MSTERPSKGMLVFQCDACYDTREFSKSEGDPISDFRACWQVLREEGWTIDNSNHLCEDCSQIAKTDRMRRRCPPLPKLKS